MTLVHIATDDTFFVDSLKSKHKTECVFCGSMAYREGGYIGYRWDCCKIVLDEEDTRGRIAMKQRLLILKMSRRELGKLLGYSTKTIKQYEWCNCSIKYAKKLMDLVKAKLKEEI